jgi:hypothetical protein
VTGLPEQDIRKPEVTVGNCVPTLLTGSFLMFDPGTGGSLEMEAPDTTASAIHMDGSFDVAHVAPGAHCVMVQGSFGLARREIDVSDKDVENVALAISAPFELKGSVVVEAALPDPLEKGSA